MSQSWDDVANIAMVDCQCSQYSAHAQLWITLNLCYHGVDHTPHCRPRAAARTRVMNVESIIRL